MYFGSGQLIISWPHMGTLRVAMASVFDRIGLDYVLPPPCSRKTLEIGASLSPEFACLPLKTTLGNYIEAIEMGADTIIMISGKGPCRFGFYAETQRRILRDAGYNCRLISFEFEPSRLPRTIKSIKLIKQDVSWNKLIGEISLGLRKAHALDIVEQRSLHVRWKEGNTGETTGLLEECYKSIGRAGNAGEIELAKKRSLDLLDSVVVDGGREKDLVKIGIVGELYLLLEPAFNLYVEEQLGGMGAYVERSIYLTDWIRPSGKNPVGGYSDEDSEAAARPYLEHHVGGEGIHTIGKTALFADSGFDGVVHIMPFTCMPETVAKSILPYVTSDKNIPVLSLVIDEQTGVAGVSTRLEAFVELARRKRRSNTDQFASV